MKNVLLLFAIGCCTSATAQHPTHQPTHESAHQHINFDEVVAYNEAVEGSGRAICKK